MIHIQKFLERLQGFESRGAKDFIMPLKDAKSLHADITRLLLALEQSRDGSKKASQDETITVEVTGGKF